MDILTKIVQRLTLERGILQRVAMCVNNLFDKKARSWKFMVGDIVLLWDKRKALKGMHKKFDTFWKVPFNIHHAFENNSFKLAYLDGEVLLLK